MSEDSLVMMELIWTEIERLVSAGRNTAIVPCGTCEEHGPHLPCITDLLIAEEVCRAAASRTKSLVAPSINLGVCVSTDGFPGTVSISPETLRNTVRDVVKSLVRQGFKTVAMATGHAGSLHISAIREACLQLAGELDVKLLIVSLFDLVVEGSNEILETHDDGHAGEIETSLVMHLRPELVRGTADANFPILPEFEIKESVRKEMGTGVMGDPAKASADKGREIFDVTVDLFVDVLDGVKR